MGCGASARHPPQEEPKANEESVGGTWATKTDGAPNKGLSEGSVTGSWKGGETVVLLDAEDNDEIEVICEAQPKRQAPRVQPAAANGQEPPEEVEPDVGQPAPKPLSKQQQEEAAKLAERRKRFDNQRYQREQRPDAAPFDAPGVVNPGPITTTTSPKPTTDMMLGLNVTEVGSKDQDPQGGLFLPGGILDDAEDLPPAPQKRDNRQQHEDLRSIGFDADDERLMRDILENFQDI